MQLDPPYPGPGRHSPWHRHYDKKYGRFSFDAVLDDLGRYFVWDGEAETVVCLCGDRDTTCMIASLLAGVR